MLRVNHAETGSATVKIAVALAPHMLMLAKPFFGAVIALGKQTDHLKGEGICRGVVYARGTQPPPNQKILAVQTAHPGVIVPAVLLVWPVMHEGRVRASKDRAANVEKVIEVPVASSMCTVVHRLWRHPPRGLADLVRVVDGYLVLRIFYALTFECPTFVRLQAQALPQEAVNLLAVARLEQVDVVHNLILSIDAFPPMPGSSIGEPRAKCMHIPPGCELVDLLLWDAL